MSSCGKPIYNLIQPQCHEERFANLPPADINECVTESPCHTSASCTNTLGSFTCGCNAGYSGDGMICNGKQCVLTCALQFIQRMQHWPG